MFLRMHTLLRHLGDIGLLSDTADGADVCTPLNV